MVVDFDHGDIAIMGLVGVLRCIDVKPPFSKDWEPGRDDKSLLLDDMIYFGTFLFFVSSEISDQFFQQKKIEILFLAQGMQ